MWNRLVWPCAFFLLGTCVYAQQLKSGSPPAAKSDAGTQLTNLFDAKIKAEWDAIRNKDQKAYGELLTDDFVGVEADNNGERYKWKVLSELEQGLVTDYTLSFLKVTSLCPDAALVRYEVFIKFPPKSLVKFEKVLVGEIWVKRDTQWKLLRYQETRVK